MKQTASTRRDILRIEVRSLRYAAAWELSDSSVTALVTSTANLQTSGRYTVEQIQCRGNQNDGKWLMGRR